MLDEVDELPISTIINPEKLSHDNKEIITPRSPKLSVLYKSSSFEKSFSDAMKAFYKRKQNEDPKFRNLSGSARKIMNLSKRSMNRSNTYSKPQNPRSHYPIKI